MMIFECVHDDHQDDDDDDDDVSTVNFFRFLLVELGFQLATCI